MYFTQISSKEWNVMKKGKRIGHIKKIDNNEYHLFSIGTPFPECFDSLDDAQDDVLENW